MPLLVSDWAETKTMCLPRRRSVVTTSRPPYTEEFRRAAIEFVRLSSKAQRQIAEDLGISDVTLLKSGQAGRAGRG